MVELIAVNAVKRKLAGEIEHYKIEHDDAKRQQEAAEDEDDEEWYRNIRLEHQSAVNALATAFEKLFNQKYEDFEPDNVEKSGDSTEN